MKFRPHATVISNFGETPNAHAHSNKIIRFQVYDYDGNLTVRIDESSIGKYICRASVKGFREISASAEVLMKGNSFSNFS